MLRMLLLGAGVVAEPPPPQAASKVRKRVIREKKTVFVWIFAFQGERAESGDMKNLLAKIDQALV
jgi:hypothetical protein